MVHLAVVVKVVTVGEEEVEVVVDGGVYKRPVECHVLEVCLVPERRQRKVEHSARLGQASGELVGKCRQALCHARVAEMTFVESVGEARDHREAVAAKAVWGRPVGDRGEHQVAACGGRGKCPVDGEEVTVFSLEVRVHRHQEPGVALRPVCSGADGSVEWSGWNGSVDGAPATVVEESPVDSAGGRQRYEPSDYRRLPGPDGEETEYPPPRSPHQMSP